MAQSIASVTAEQFADLARANGWTRKQTRNQLYQLNDESLWAQRDAIMLALGFATTDQTAAAQQAAAEEDKRKQSEAEKAAQARLAAESAQRAAAEQEAAKQSERAHAAALAAIADGAVIWCDSCENTVTKVVNSYGRQVKFDNGGYRAALKIGAYEEVFVNRNCPDQFAGECWSVLKAIEFACQRGLKSCTVRNDRIGGFDSCNAKTAKRGYLGAKYLFVAQKMAAEHGLEVTFEPCSSAENLADSVGRRAGKGA